MLPKKKKFEDWEQTCLNRSAVMNDISDQQWNLRHIRPQEAEAEAKVEDDLSALTIEDFYVKFFCVFFFLYWFQVVALPKTWFTKIIFFLCPKNRDVSKCFFL